MFKSIIYAIVATASIGVVSIGTAEARDHDRHRHNRSNVIIEFGGFGNGMYGSQFDRDYGYGNTYYGGDYGYDQPRRYNRHYGYDYYQPNCGIRTIKVKKWNRSHTRYSLVKKRVRTC